MSKDICAFCSGVITTCNKGVLVHQGKAYTSWIPDHNKPLICFSCVKKIKEMMDREDMEVPTA